MILKNQSEYISGKIEGNMRYSKFKNIFLRIETE